MENSISKQISLLRAERSSLEAYRLNCNKELNSFGTLHELIKVREVRAECSLRIYDINILLNDLYNKLLIKNRNKTLVRLN